MTSQPAIDVSTTGRAERGRTPVRQHTIELATASQRWPALGPLMTTAEAVTHVEVTVVRGPFGDEVIIHPRSGAQSLPGELYALLPGAFPTPASYDHSSGSGLAWCSSNAALQNYLRTHEFGASALPGGHRSADHDIVLDWTIQLSALDVDRSLVVCQLSSDAPTVLVAALEVVDRLATATAQTRAEGGHAAPEALRFSPLVELALSGQLDTPDPEPVRDAPMPPPPGAFDAAPPVPEAPMPPPPAAADAVPPPPVAADAVPAPAPAPAAVEAQPPSPAIAEPAPVVEPTFDASANDWESATSSAHSIDARSTVAEALRRYEGKRVSIAPITDQKKLANVLRAVAPGIDADEIVGFVDTGIRANGKSGAIFTASAIHFTEVSTRHHYLYTAIESFELESSAVVLNGTDGSRAKISTADQTFAIAEAVVAATGLQV